ncbi:MAG: VWA domain-containing protein [Terracidiphilus sp.]
MRVERIMLRVPLLPGVCVCLLLLTALVSAVAQNPTLKTRSKEERDREYMASRRITLNVQVTDEAGKPVTDLGARDFALFDNHQPRKLAAFHAIDGEALNDATEVVFVLDAVNSTTSELEAEKDGIFKYLARSHGPLPYPTSFVLWFNGHLKATGPTTDRNTIGRAFVSITKNVHSNACAPADTEVVKVAKGGDTRAAGDGSVESDGANAANCQQIHFKDSIAALDGIAEQQVSLGGRTILIWFGPGWPLATVAEFQEMTQKARKNYFDEIVTVLHDLRASQVTLDVIAPRDPTHEDEKASMVPPPPTAGAASPESARPDSLALPVLARQTGGQVIASSSDVVADLGKFLDDADWYYALSFNSAPAQNGVELRSLEVKVNRPALNVRTTIYYYTEP